MHTKLAKIQVAWFDFRKFVFSGGAESRNRAHITHRRARLSQGRRAKAIAIRKSVHFQVILFSKY